jgi:hypothetical protein
MLRLPARVFTESIRTMAECGKGRFECVTYWTGSATNRKAIDGWTHPAHRRSPFGYQIDDTWLTKFWFQLAGEHRAVRAQVHTHPNEAFHSDTDDHWPLVSQPGFISIVVPNFAIGSVDLNKIWVGMLMGDGSWKQVSIFSMLEVQNEESA